MTQSLDAKQYETGQEFDNIQHRYFTKDVVKEVPNAEEVVLTEQEVNEIHTREKAIIKALRKDIRQLKQELLLKKKPKKTSILTRVVYGILVIGAIVIAGAVIREMVIKEERRRLQQRQQQQQRQKIDEEHLLRQELRKFLEEERTQLEKEANILKKKRDKHNREADKHNRKIASTNGFLDTLQSIVTSPLEGYYVASMNQRKSDLEESQKALQTRINQYDQKVYRLNRYI